MKARQTKRPSLSSVSRKLRAHMPELRSRHGIASLKVFGSVARGENTRRSDVDLLVEFEPGRSVTLLGFVAIEREISELLGCKVDLVEPGALRPHLGERILAEAVPI